MSITYKERFRASGIFFFFFNDTATTEIYTLSLHDALPISRLRHRDGADVSVAVDPVPGCRLREPECGDRSEEHTSELQSRLHLVCRLLLEKKKNGRRCFLRRERPDLVEASTGLPVPRCARI